MTREEEIKTEAGNYTNNFVIPNHNLVAFKKGFLIGVKWADQHPRQGLWDSEKVCKFIKENIREYHKSGVFHVNDFIDDLYKAMEE